MKGVTLVRGTYSFLDLRSRDLNGAKQGAEPLSYIKNATKPASLSGIQGHWLLSFLDTPTYHCSLWRGVHRFMLRGTDLLFP